MMTDEDVLALLIEAGARLQPNGDEVDVELPPDLEVTDELLAAMRRAKPLLVAYARSVEATRQREAGIVPAHYTATTECRGCGPVPIFPGCPPGVDACPWCVNRSRGLPVPSAERVTVAEAS